jgi:DNA segregation ATPase FtsK/SpoIIIE, S-DNA-T family
VSNHLDADQTLELLENLRNAVREFAEREETLSRDFRAALDSVRRRREEAAADAAAFLAEEIQRTDLSAQEARQRTTSRRESRKARIVELQKAATKRALKEIENQEGGRKHKLQAETLQIQRERESALADADSTREEFKNTLAGEREVLDLLEENARGAFRGFKQFVGYIAVPPENPPPDPASDEYHLLAELREGLNQIEKDLNQFRKRPGPAFFRFLPVWLALLFCLAPLVPLLRMFGVTAFTYVHAVASIVGGLVLGFILHRLSRRQCEPFARAIAGGLARAGRLHDLGLEKAEARHARELERTEKNYQTKTDSIQIAWNQAVTEAEQARETRPPELDQKADRLLARNEEQCGKRLEGIRRGQEETTERLKEEAETRARQLTGQCAKREAALTADYDEQWRRLEQDWQKRLRPLSEVIQAAQAAAAERFPPWTSKQWERWTPPARFGEAASWARLEVDVEKLAEGCPKDPRLALPVPVRFDLPLLLAYPRQGSVLFESAAGGREEAIGSLNNMVLRLLSVAPPGRLSFTIIDPVGLGQSFSGLMHLSDYAEHVINSRIWTQPGQIEQRLAALNEHMEKVIQMYLRNEYETISEYNEQAGNIAEKYHFVVVADFPANFSDAAARRLLSIATSGARCGVFTLIHWDRRLVLPQDFGPDELKRSGVSVLAKEKGFFLNGKPIPGATLVLEAPPPPEFAIEFIQKIGLANRDSNRVEVPFAQVAPEEAGWWSLDTTAELRVPIGRTGATKLQYLAIGKGTRQHALVAGKTGSGKSTLFHVLITNLALWCSPEQVEFYLIDFKKGVEFKCYATHRLPHARVVAIESDREFGLSVLLRLDEELKRRGDLFRKLGAQDLAGYKRAGGTEAVPRSLLIVDEFQEFFVEDDKIAQTASLLLDRIVRQGRAFGIHVLLGSQTLGGAYTVARATLGQMVIRIALQCNEADAYLIMDDNNPAPRLLSRPGEGIYNDTAGTVEGNSPFQVVWLPDEERDAQLGRVRRFADQKDADYPGPIVFEGNAPADVRENPVLRQWLEAESIRQPASPRIWLGAPNSIKGPTEAVFHRQSGNNLLLVGQRDEAILAILSVALTALAAQHPRGKARFVLFDGTPPETAPRVFLDRILAAIPHPVTVARPGDVSDILTDLAGELARRADDPRAAELPPVFLVIHGAQKFNKLRYEEDFGFSTGDAEAAPNPGTLLNNLICEGTRLGFHVIAACDTFNNVNRFFSRKAFSEFEMRVLFQMSANDSASLIDSPKAASLGLHRALFYNEQEGYLETFRPYALPARDWIDSAARHLKRLLG